MIESRPSGIVVSDADYGAVGPGFKPREGMDVCKCIVPSRHGGILNRRRAISPPMRLMGWKGEVKARNSRVVDNHLKRNRGNCAAREALEKAFVSALKRPDSCCHASTDDRKD
ncbi:hypothetical protein TNCV_2759571 [Trichonephila clavipes]|nr:hypothetical protein TNCV_2759571 [Trichonephila clavipes]